MRKTGIDILGDVPWGTHFCQFYQTKEDLIDILVPYFKAGLENNEFCMWVTSEPLSEKEAKNSMRTAVPNFDQYLKKGQIEIVPHEEWYLKEGTFIIQRVLNAWIDKYNQALTQGYDGIRVTANLAWLEERDWRNFIEYEEKMNNVIDKYRMMAICTYSLDKCGASEVIDVVSNHQFALIRKEGKWATIESSERKRAEEVLRKSEGKYRSLFDNIREGFAYCKIIVDKNNKPVDFKYIEVNDAFEMLTGLKKEHVTGKRATEAIPGIKKAHPELFKIYGKVALTGKATNFDIYFEPLKIWLSISVYCPKRGHFVAVFDNITERKNAEEELKNSRAQLRNLVARLQSIREEERRLIAREIHDELGQSLTALKMDLYWLKNRIPKDQKSQLEKTKSMSKLIDKTIQRIKKISAALRPELLDYLGLPAAIEWEGEEFQNRTGIKCEVYIDSEDIIMEQDRSTAIFRIFQEALTNAARHSNATRVKVSLKEKAGKLDLRVRDNGKGITEKQISDPKSFGLIGMRERALFLGGEVKIRGVQDKGTTIIATIPLPKKGKT